MRREERDGKGKEQGLNWHRIRGTEVRKTKKTRTSRPGPHMDIGRKLLIFFPSYIGLRSFSDLFSNANSVMLISLK